MRDAKSRFAESTQRAGSSRSPSDRSRTSATLGALALAIVAVLVVGTASASAATYGHTTVTAEFGTNGTSATSFSSSNIGNIVYQQANKRIYIQVPGSIYGFSNPSPGTFTPLGGSFPLSISGGGGDSDMAVDNTAGTSANNIYYTPDSSQVLGFNSTGTGLSGWPVSNGSETCGVAVDNTGTVWTGNYSGARVVKFSPSGGSSIGQVSTSGNPCKLAIDPSNNDLYVGPWGGAISRYTAASGYTEIKKFDDGGGSNDRWTVNGAKHRLYVAHSGVIDAYDTATGALLEEITAGKNFRSVAVNEATDTLYAFSTSNNRIKEIPGALIPKVTTGEPTGNTSVGGTVDPDGGGNITECAFEYVEAAKYQPSATNPYSEGPSPVPCSESLPISGAQAVTANLPGLLGETTYHYRLVAGNANTGGKNFGADETITPHNVKGLKTENAENVTRTGATMKASFEGNGEETHYYFEWGTTTAYGTKSATPPGPSAGSPTFPPATSLSFNATGLQPGTLCHYRVVGENGLGVSPGGDKTFTTLPAVQNLTTEPATGVTPHTAVLHGSFVGDGTDTTYKFEWGKTTSYGNSTTLEDAGTPSGLTNLSAGLPGLELATTYHYRVVATNSLGTTKGGDQSFQTKKAVESLVTKPASPITQDGITLNAEFEGTGLDTHYYFEYGTTTAYGTKTDEPPGSDAGTTVGPTPLSAEISNFQDYTTYHYRVVASNSLGQTAGPDETFSTLAAPLPEIATPAVSNVTQTSALLSAQVNPNRWPTVYLFEWGPSTAYGSSTPLDDVIGGLDNQRHPVGATVTGLTPATVYHFRVVAINFSGTTNGLDQTFTTPDVPRIKSSGVATIGQTSAHLNALVAGNASPTSVSFEYGPSTSYGQHSSGIFSGQSLIGQSVGTDITGLAPSTTYHFRAVAVNGIGAASGPDLTFTTQAAPEASAPKQPKKCRKGFVKRHGKCVKRNAPRKKHRKHHRHSTRSHG